MNKDFSSTFQTSGMIPTESPSETLYFAYGSNLSTTQMLQRCPSASPVGLAYLHGWEWLINARGYANIVQVQKLVQRVSGPRDKDFSCVYGVLYLLQPEDEVMLDKYEGVPLAYQKVVLGVKIVEGSDTNLEKEAEIIKALVYVDGTNITESTPKPEYIVRMNRGIDEAVNEWQLPRWYVESVMRKYIPANKADEVKDAEKQVAGD
jgi:gamma-glutamylcyclotransferase